MKKNRLFYRLMVLMTAVVFMANSVFADWDTTSVPGEISTTDNVTIGGSLDVTGPIDTTDNANIDGTLTVNGPVTTNDDVDISSFLQVGDDIILPVNHNIQFGDKTTGVDAYIGFTDFYLTSDNATRLIMSNFAYVDGSLDDGFGFSDTYSGSGIDIFGPHIYFHSRSSGTTHTNASINGVDGHFSIYNDLGVNGNITVSGDISTESIDVRNDTLNFTGGDVVISQKLGIGTTAAPQSELDVAGMMTAESIDVGSGTYKILEPGTELTSALLDQEGVTFILPPGDYTMPDAVLLHNSYISIIGFKGTNIIKTVENGRLVVDGDHCLFQNFTFDRNSQAGDNIAILSCVGNKFENIYMHDSSSTVAAYGPGFYLNNANETQIVNCVIKGNITGGIVFNHNPSNNCSISGNLIEGNGSGGITIHGGSKNCKVIGNRITNSNANGIGLNYASECIIVDNIVENHTSSGIQLRSPDVSSISHHNIISNNYLASNGDYGIDFYSQYPEAENKNMVIGNTCNSNTLGAMRIVDISDNRIAFNEGTDYDLSGDVMIDGSVGIGTNNIGDYKLAVEGKIGARDLVVTLADWADYVFEADYHLASLDEVQSYIQENKHLPGIPSEREIQSSGLSVSQLLSKQMAKIEELTLYIIDLEDRIDALEKHK